MLMKAADMALGPIRNLLRVATVIGVMFLVAYLFHALAV